MRKNSTAAAALLFLGLLPWAHAETRLLGRATEARTTTFRLNTGVYRAEAVAPNILRCRFQPAGYRPAADRYRLASPPAAKAAASEITLRPQPSPFLLEFLDRQGRAFARQVWTGDGQTVQFELDGSESLYGLGEYLGPLDRRGRSFAIWNRQAQLPIDLWFNQAYLPVPLVLSSRGYALFFDNHNEATLRVGRYAGESISYRATAGPVDFYVIYGPGLARLVEAYTLLTGRPPIPPRWALGYLQSKYGYENESEVRELAREFRRRNVPADAIILDLYWFEKMGDLDWNRKRFPNPEQMLRDLAAQGFQTIVISEPYVREDSRLFRPLSEAGHLLKGEDGRAYTFGPVEWIGGRVGLVDFTNPAAQEFWWQAYAALLRQGVAGWWTDLGEPEDHPLPMARAQEIHNIFNLEWSRSLYERQRRDFPDRRVFILSRSGFAGSQRYGVSIWSGDVGSRFDTLAAQVPIGLSAGLSGFPYWGTDVGGFEGTPSAELFVRWNQLGTFTPTYRAHGNRSAREPWAYGPEAERIIADFLRLRYRLLPYIYSYAAEAHRTGLPLMRPLAMYWPGDPRALAAGAADSQYLFGRELLIKPVTQPGAQQTRIYLPSGQWYDFWNDQALPGGREISVETPLERIPVFVRASSIVPMQPAELYVKPGAPAALFLHVYPGEERARFAVYDDDGVTYAYEQGAFAETVVSAEVGPDTLKLEIAAPRGGYAPHLAGRSYRFVVHGRPRPKEVSVSGWTWDGATGAATIPARVGSVLVTY